MVDDGDYPVYGANGIVGKYDKFNHAEPQLLITCRGATCGAVNVSQPNSWINGNAMVVKPRDSSIQLKFLEHLFRGGVDLQAVITGAAQPQITRQSLAPLKIRVPPLSEQRRIAAILDQADALRVKRREALAQLDSLTQSIFIEMFGDPISNPLGWGWEKLESCFQFKTGKLDSNAAVENGTYPFFTCSREDLQIDTFAFDCEALLLAGNNASADYSVKHYKGKFNAYQRTYVITLRNQSNSYEYAAFVLENHLAELKRLSKGSNTKYLTLELMNRIRIPIPPASLQRQFTTRIAEVNQLRNIFRASLAELDNLFASLQHRAFRGEL